ncbi:uncharacterized protein LOC111064344 [Nilaparvata lugens]|uniref:uncharacterized protein LOC111064344 n=1 Tax=Nilaparvata lugens TaxID=108931 RepID=UPI00193CEA14|nr:uncharacterized protein LOC111064344 [Nilaparvata lugens]
MFQGVYFVFLLFSATLGDEWPQLVIGGSKNKLASAMKPCIIPYNKEYFYFTNEVDRLKTGENINGDGKLVISVKCYSSRKIIKPSDFAVCFDGELYPTRHTCDPVQKKCAPKYDSYATIYSCTTPKGVQVSCELPAEPGTKLTVRCAHWRYKPPDVDMVREKFCQQNGEWEEHEDCSLQCGKLINKDHLNVTNNNSDASSLLFPISSVPWHATILVYLNSKWYFVCPATMISNVLVITAFSCFEKISWKILPLKISVGHNQQYQSLTEMYDVGQVYLSEERLSIALVGVREYIEFSDTVGSICVGDILSLDTRLGRMLFWNKDSKSQTLSYNECQSLKGINRVVGSNFFCNHLDNFTFSPVIIGLGLYLHDQNTNVTNLEAVLVDRSSDGEFGVYADVREEANRNFITIKTQEFGQWLLKNYNGWWRRRLKDKQ